MVFPNKDGVAGLDVPKRADCCVPDVLEALLFPKPENMLVVDAGGCAAVAVEEPL